MAINCNFAPTEIHHFCIKILGKMKQKSLWFNDSYCMRIQHPFQWNAKPYNNIQCCIKEIPNNHKELFKSLAPKWNQAPLPLNLFHIRMEYPCSRRENKPHLRFLPVKCTLTQFDYLHNQAKQMKKKNMTLLDPFQTELNHISAEVKQALIHKYEEIHSHTQR